MDHREKLLSIVKEKGPLLPAQLNKEMHTNVLFASAMLSEMVDQKKIRLTSMKVGGSPLYYCEGQEPALEEYANKMPETDYNAFLLLKRSKILKDKEQDPQTRVSLRQINDFAVPLEVTVNSHADLFWKYYLLPDAEAEGLIRDYVHVSREKEEGEKEQKTEVQATITEVAEAEKVDVSAGVEVKKPEVVMSHIESTSVPEFSYEPSVEFSTMVDTDEKIKIERKKPDTEVPAIAPFPEDDKFFKKVKSYFDESGIEIVAFEIIKKASEYDFVLKIPSNVGILNYYCKAKAKAKIADSDLSTAFVYGQMKKLPILFLTSGDMNKKAEELLTKEFKNMFYKKI